MATSERKEINKLGRELRYIAQKRPRDIVRDLEKIEVADRKYTNSRKRYQTWLSISVIFIFASFFLMFILWLGITFLAVAIVASLIFGYCYSKYARLKLEPYRYSIVKKLAYLLERDMSATSNLNVDLDFTKSIIKPKLVSEGKHPTRRGWNLKIYQDSWLKIAGEFCDRTNFELNITEQHHHASGWKRGRSGKRKHKSKHKFKGSEICLQLRYPAKKYGAIQVLQQDADKAIALPEYARLKSFKLNNKSIFLKAKISPQFDLQTRNSRGMSQEQKIDTTYETVTAMFLSLYQILNLARTLSK